MPRFLQLVVIGIACVALSPGVAGDAVRGLTTFVSYLIVVMDRRLMLPVLPLIGSVISYFRVFTYTNVLSPDFESRAGKSLFRCVSHD